MHVLVIALVLLWLSWPIGLAFVALVFLLAHRKGWWHDCTRRSGAARRTMSARGNSAFEKYRAETLRRVDEEQRKFREFLDGLRKSKDKEEFDRFMADRRARRTDEGPQGATA